MQQSYYNSPRHFISQTVRIDEWYFTEQHFQIRAAGKNKSTKHLSDDGDGDDGGVLEGAFGLAAKSVTSAYVMLHSEDVRSLHGIDRKLQNE